MDKTPGQMSPDARTVSDPSEILDASCVALDIPALTKSEAVSALLDLLATHGVVSDTEKVLEDIEARERVMSTGIGGGIAVPHAQSEGAGRLALALGRTKTPIDFESLDNRPVQLIFLLVGPEERGGFIRVLARISRLLYSGDLQRKLLQAESPAQVMRFLQEEESSLRR